MLKSAPHDVLPLFESYPRLRDGVPWISLGDWPTPVVRARQFEQARGLRAFYVKREDKSHAECGGNKVRGLEFLLAEARRRGAKTIITCGSAGSHHISKTAWHARRLGMNTIALIVPQPSAEYVRRNLLVGLSAGTRFVAANYVTLLPKLAWRFAIAATSRNEGGVCLIPPGGTSPRSCLGHVSAALELRNQIDAGILPEPDYLYAAMGSLGTVAGLALGCRLAGLRTRIVGVTVSYRWYCTRGRWARLARRTAALLQRHDPGVPEVVIDPAELTVIGTALGAGYARFTESGAALATQFSRCEGIEVDGTYTAKTLDGAVQFIRQNGLEDRVHLFWHTYHCPPAAEAAFEPAFIPSGLRRYFAEPPQPLDEKFSGECDVSLEGQDG